MVKMAGKFFAGLLAVLFLTGVAFADSECSKGTRKYTGAENKAYASAVEAIKAALPPAPQGWKMGNVGASQRGETVCMDDDNHPIGASVSVTYEKEDREELYKKYMDGQVQSQKKIYVLADDPKKKLLSRQNEAIKKSVDAIMRKDKGEQEKYQKEIDSINKEIRAIDEERMARHIKEVEPYIQLLKDTQAKIYISSMTREGETPWDARQMDKIIRFLKIDGATYAYRQSESGKTKDKMLWEEGKTVAHVGTWKEDRENKSIKSVIKKVSGISSMQAVIITVKADDKRAEQMLKGMNFSKLLIK